MTMRWLAIAAAGMVGACGLGERAEPVGEPRKEVLVAVTDSHQLLRFNGGQPQKILARVALTGLEPGEKLVGIDYRVSRGVLFGLTRAGRLVTIHAQTGAVTTVGPGKMPVALEGDEVGFDFNPVVDRIRVITSEGLNLRLHPETGAVVDADPQREGLQTDGRLAFSPTDGGAGTPVNVMAAAYTYNRTNDKITTNFAIDGRQGLLLMQGTREGATPAVSPNTGQLFTVGALGVGQMVRAAFDISDASNAAYAAFTFRGAKASRLHSIDLATGSAKFIGTIGGGEPIVGLAIEP